MHLRARITPAVLATAALAATELKDTLAPARNQPALGCDTVARLNLKLQNGRNACEADLHISEGRPLERASQHR